MLPVAVVGVSELSIKSRLNSLVLSKVTSKFLVGWIHIPVVRQVKTFVLLINSCSNVNKIFATTYFIGEF